jgi:hypothetical protein
MRQPGINTECLIYWNNTLGRGSVQEAKMRPRGRNVGLASFQHSLKLWDSILGKRGLSASCKCKPPVNTTDSGIP